MAKSTEILVHVSAPSRASDDARYRREALGTLHFEVGIRHAVLVHKNQTFPRPEPASMTVQGGGGSFTDTEWSPTTSARGAQSSSLDPRVVQDRTVLGIALGIATGPRRTPEAPRASLSRLPTSETAALKPWSNLSSKLPYIHVEHTPANPRPRSAPIDPSYVQETPRFRRAQSDSWETPPSVVPDSQPSLPNLKRPFSSSSPSPTRRSDSRSPKRQRCRSSSPSVDAPSQICPSSPKPASPSLQQPGSRISPVRPTAEKHRFPLSESDSLPLVTVLAIYAPSPQPSTESFETHVTPYLKILVDHLPPITFFIPQQLEAPLRELHVHERGHWAFPIPSFPPGEWQKFWSYLETFIRMSRASFGVSCVVEGRRSDEGGRNREHGRGELEEAEVAESRRGKDVKVGRSEETILAKDKEQRPNEEALMQSVEKPLLKLYCWGEIVPHIWLLLFTASHRRIKGCGAQWIDARGEVIIQMK